MHNITIEILPTSIVIEAENEYSRNQIEKVAQVFDPYATLARSEDISGGWTSHHFHRS